MKTNQLDLYKKVFFIGIGGISMSGLAEVLNQDGKSVFGSDQNPTPLTDRLKTLGITVYRGHEAEHITKELDLVVYTAAIKEDNVEFQEAVDLGIPMMDRATLLGLIMDGYETSIGVAGTHGKTTTTSMISHILMEGNLDPTISVGAMLKGIGGNFKVGKSDYFITEACEYANSYHKFLPNISIILNIEEDHLDFFKDLDDIRNSFHRYMLNTKAGGVLIVNDCIDGIQELTGDLPCEVITVGHDPASSFSCRNIAFDSKGYGSYDLCHLGETIGHIRLKVTGMHNIMNSLAAIAAGLFIGLDLDTIRTGLLKFEGADRRFEYKGSFNGVTVIDDYAHHPTEIATTIEATKKIGHHELWVVFQPHTYTRTKALFSEFIDALKDIDHLILTDIYAAREKDPGDIHSAMFVESLSKSGMDIVYFDDFNKIVDHLKKNCVPNDMLITMGAGNVHLIGEMLLEP